MNRLKYYFLKFQPYVVGVICFLMLFVIWRLGVWLGFTSLRSLMVGIGGFLLSSSMYVVLLQRGAAQYQDLEVLLRDDADQAVLNASPADREEVSLLRERLLQSIARLRAGTRGRHSRDALYALPLLTLQAAGRGATPSWRVGTGAVSLAKASTPRAGDVK